MPRLPNLIRTPLRRGADAVSVASFALDQAAGVLRRVAGEDRHEVPVQHRSTPQPVPTAKPASPPEPTAKPARSQAKPARSQAKPARSQAKRTTVGRTAGERREPTPEPAKGASAATRGSRQISNPKAARKNRARAERATSLTSVDASAGTGHGGTPETITAENTPKERAKAKAGREPAPMGSQDSSQ